MTEHDASEAPPDSAPEAAPPAEPAAHPATFAMSETARALALELVRRLSDAAADENDRAEKSLLLHETAEIDERVHNDELGSARSYLAAFNARPVFRPPLFGLIRLYTRRRSVNNLAKLLDALVKAAPTAREKAEALVERGHLAEDRMDDRAGAMAAYEEAVTSDPAYRGTWLALERAALRDQDAPGLRRALVELARLSSDPMRRARLLTEVAWELAREGDPSSLDEAARYLHEAAALPVGRWRAWLELERFAEQTGRAHDRCAALEGRARLAAGLAAGETAGEASGGGSGTFAVTRLANADVASRTAADLWSRAARVRWLGMGELENAAVDLQQAITMRPDDARVRALALHLCDQMGDTAGASMHAEWLLEHVPGDPGWTSALFYRRAEAAAAAGNGAEANELLGRALAALPGGSALLAAQVDQFEAAGDGAGAAALFDRLAQGEPDVARRAMLRRTGGTLLLALGGDTLGALQQFRAAAADDPADALARRAMLVLAPRAGGLEPTEQLRIIDELLPVVRDDDEKTALLFDRLRIERFVVGDAAAAAATAQTLALAAPGDPFVTGLAMTHAAALAQYSIAADHAERLVELRADDPDARADWTGAAARLRWAAGDEARARSLATTLHLDRPEEPYLATLAFRLALAGNDPSGALEVLVRRASSLTDDASATRWLLVGSVLLAGAGAPAECRRALDQASERAPESAAVRAALLAHSRWRADGAVRGQLAEAALRDPDASDDAVALGVQLVLARAFIEHDMPAALQILASVVAHAGTESLAVTLLNAIVSGSQRGPDSQETVDALHAVRAVLPEGDTLRAALDLETARAVTLSTSGARGAAGDARRRVEQGQTQAVAPKLLALLDAVQHEDRSEIPASLGRVADIADDATAAVLRSVALASMRAHGRDNDARALAQTHPTLVASRVALAEMPYALDQSASRADAIRARAELADERVRPALVRRAAMFDSLGGRDLQAVERLEVLLADDPDDLVAWDILRVAGRRMQAWPRVVEACVSLAERVRDNARAGALWEEAGVVYVDELKDQARAENAFRRSLENDPKRLVAYGRLREMLEERKDLAELDNLVSTRIAAIQEQGELAELWWEQARFRRAQGRRDEALESAKNVVAIDPEHVAAWAMVAEINATSGQLEAAAEALVMLARAKECPPANRKAARLGALDIYQHRLGRADLAVAQIEALVTDGGADDALLERGVQMAIGAQRWEEATRMAQLSVDRARSPVHKSNAFLRMSQMLGDQAGDAAGALRSAQSAHDAMPSHMDALRRVHELADMAEGTRRARRTLDALRDAMRTEGITPEAVASLVEAAQLAGDGVLTRAAQRTLNALGGGVDGTLHVLRTPSGKLSLREPGMLLRYRDENDSGAPVALLEAVLPDMNKMLGLTTDALGVGRGERIRGAHPVRDALVPWMNTAGWKDFELYIGGTDDRRVLVVPGDEPSIVLGKKVTAPFDDATRFRITRALLLAARGVGALQLVAAGVAADIVLAAMVAAELPITGGAQRFEARLRPVAKALSRKVRKGIAESGRGVASAADPQGDLVSAALAVLSTVRRGALAVSGATTEALTDLNGVDPFPSSQRDLCLFSLSDAAATLAKETGVDLA